jgi:hypothetical protein
MRFGTVTFQGETGKHRHDDGRECGGRFFDVKFVGVGGVYTNVGACRLCERELVAYENGLAPEPAQVGPQGE